MGQLVNHSIEFHSLICCQSGVSWGCRVITEGRKPRSGRHPENIDCIFAYDSDPLKSGGSSVGVWIRQACAVQNCDRGARHKLDCHTPPQIEVRRIAGRLGNLGYMMATAADGFE